jgi:hypothetical protein
MEMASPDLEKQGFFAVVFVNREYNGLPDRVAKKDIMKSKCCATRSCPN